MTTEPAVFEGLSADRFLDIDLTSEDLRQNFRAVLSQWATQPPFYVMQSGSPQAVVARFADVREVLGNRERFSSVPPQRAAGKFQKFMPSKFMTVTPPTQMEGPVHSRIRRLINPAFSPAAIDDYKPRIDATIAAIVAKMKADGPLVDGMAAFATQLMPAVLLQDLFNLSPEHAQIFVDMNRALKLTARMRPGEAFPPEYLERFNRAEAAINTILAERLANPGDDLISKLALTVDGGDQLTREDLFDLVFTFTVGALDSTATATGGVLYSLLSHPDQLEELKQDLSLLPTAIEEGYRYHGAGFLLFTRYALQDTELNGVPFLEGMPVYVCHQAASYDPDVYPDPLRFDIRRNPANVMMFGGGIHHCVGHRLARTVIETALGQLFRAFPGVQLADPAFKPRLDGANSETQLTTLPLRLW